MSPLPPGWKLPCKSRILHPSQNISSKTNTLNRKPQTHTGDIKRIWCLFHTHRLWLWGYWPVYCSSPPWAQQSPLLSPAAAPDIHSALWSTPQTPAHTQTHTQQQKMSSVLIFTGVLQSTQIIQSVYPVQWSAWNIFTDHSNHTHIM